MDVFSPHSSLTLLRIFYLSLVWLLAHSPFFGRTIGIAIISDCGCCAWVKAKNRARERMKERYRIHWITIQNVLFSVHIFAFACTFAVYYTIIEQLTGRIHINFYCKTLNHVHSREWTETEKQTKTHRELRKKTTEKRRKKKVGESESKMQNRTPGSKWWSHIM